MLEIVVLYLLFNILAGICLSVIQLIKGGSKISATHWLLLLFFPVLGWGKVEFSRTQLNGEPVRFPEKWFVYEYMLKLHKIYLLAQLLIPIAIASVFFFITPSDFVDSGDSMTDAIVGTLFGFGFLAILFIVLFFTLIWIGLQYLILVMLPKSSQRTIERGILMKQTAPTAPPTPAKPKRTPVKLYPQIEAYVAELPMAFDTILKERRMVLKELAECISRKRADNESINLMFICTHNSRRSQFGQIWAAVAAAHRGISGVQTFSGGTEETAFNKRAVSAIERAGLKVEGTVSTNPRYSVRFSDEIGALDCFSKVYDSNANPQKGFIAVMTCSDADENCPIVTGAEHRFRITYEDPKVSDRTVQEVEVYDERCRQIAAEMLYLFSLID